MSAQDQFKIQLVYEAAAGMEDDVSDFRADVSALSGAIGTAIETIKRPLSRAEVLFAVLDGNGTMEKVTISQQDWFASRDS